MPGCLRGARSVSQSDRGVSEFGVGASFAELLVGDIDSPDERLRDRAIAAGATPPGRGARLRMKASMSSDGFRRMKWTCSTSCECLWRRSEARPIPGPRGTSPRISFLRRCTSGHLLCHTPPMSALSCLGVYRFGDRARCKSTFFFVPGVLSSWLGKSAQVDDFFCGGSLFDMLPVVRASRQRLGFDRLVSRSLPD